PLIIAYAPATPDRARIEPTDKSMPPETITTVMPIAMMVITAVCLATLARLPAERNLGSRTAINRHNATRLANGRNRLIHSDIDYSAHRKSSTHNLMCRTGPNWEWRHASIFLPE